MGINPKIAIIVLNWNGFNDTVECLESLRKVGYEDFKTVLVDNGSANDEGKRLKERFPEVHLIQNIENRGFAGGNNDGMNWALANGFEYIVNLNNDCIVEPHWLDILLKGIRDAGADFASSMILYYPETGLICSDGDVVLMDGAGMSKDNFRAKKDGPGAGPIFSACGAASMYSKRCLEDVKLKGHQFFDELYFAYFEDVDLGIRLNARDYKGVLVPDAVVYHKGNRTSGFHSFFQRFQTEKNRLLNELLNYPLWLVPLGEVFHFAKLFSYGVCSLFRGKHRDRRDSAKISVLMELKVMAGARIWLIRNFSKVWEDRKERKSKASVNHRIIFSFYWDMLNILGIRSVR